MQRFNKVAITLFASSFFAIACQKNTQDTEPPPDSTMASDDSATQEPMPTESPSETPAEPAQPEPPKELAAADKSFVESAAMGGMAEVELSTLALTKAKKTAVKDFAQKMVDDHGKANEELKGLAGSKNAQVPAEMDQEHKDKKAELEKLSGTKFEKAYVAAMLADHEKAVTLFRDYSQSGTDAELKDWAGKTLPTLEMHLAHVQAVKAGKKYTPPKDDAAATASAEKPAAEKPAATK